MPQTIKRNQNLIQFVKKKRNIKLTFATYM